MLSFVVVLVFRTPSYEGCWEHFPFNAVGSFNPTTGILFLWERLDRRQEGLLANSMSLKFHKYVKHEMVQTALAVRTPLTPPMMK